MLTSRTYFKGCAETPFKFGEFVVGINERNLETAGSEKGKDLFNTSYDICRTAFVCAFLWFSRFLIMQLILLKARTP